MSTADVTRPVRLVIRAIVYTVAATLRECAQTLRAFQLEPHERAHLMAALMEIETVLRVQANREEQGK